MKTGIIYHAFDTTTGKAYVGQTVGTLEKRRKEHLSCKYNLPFANALRKRSKCFVWSVLTIGLSTQKDLDDAEIYWGLYFDCLFPNGYNLKLGQGHSWWSDEECARVSAALQQPETNQKLRNSLKKVMGTPEARQKNSESKKLAHARSDVKVKVRAAQKAAQGKPETKAKRNATMADPLYKAVQSRRMKEVANRPGLQERKSASMKDYWIKRKSGVK